MYAGALQDASVAVRRLALYAPRRCQLIDESLVAPLSRALTDSSESVRRVCAMRLCTRFAIEICDECTERVGAIGATERSDRRLQQWRASEFLSA